jgi:hypothetical protein
MENDVATAAGIAVLFGCDPAAGSASRTAPDPVGIAADISGMVLDGALSMLG